MGNQFMVRRAAMAIIAGSMLTAHLGMVGCVNYDRENRPTSVQDRPTDPDRQQVQDINRDIGRDAGLMP